MRAGVVPLIPLVPRRFTSVEDLISSYFASLYPVGGLQTEGMGIAQRYGGKASERGA